MTSVHPPSNDFSTAGHSPCLCLFPLAIDCNQDEEEEDHIAGIPSKELEMVSAQDALKVNERALAEGRE